jgi:hypothetical protein
MHSVISILSICRNVVHFYLFYLWTKVVLALLDGTTPIRAGAWKVVGTVSMGKTDDAFTLA